MNLVKSNDTLIDLQKVSANQLQTLFEQGKRDELTCPVCLEAMRLYIGIHEIPYFYHTRSTSICQGLSSTPSTDIEVDTKQKN